MVAGRIWRSAPRFLVSAPQLSQSVIDRPRLTALINQRLTQPRVLMVTAPAGYGKTSLVSSWAAGYPGTVAWLTLSEFDTDAVRLFSGVVSALQAAPARGGRRPLQLPVDSTVDDRAAYLAVCDAIATYEDDLVLVVDDTHLAAPTVRGSLLGHLVEASPPNLRLVLLGRHEPDLALERLRLAGEVRDLGPAELEFTAAEIVTVAGRLGRSLTVPEAEQIRRYTEGWPVAVRLALVSTEAHPGGGRATSAATTMALSNYLIQEVLDQLPPELSEFVLDATTCDWVDARLAAALTGPDGPRLLQECLRRGLPLQPYGLRDRSPLYRWHSVWATQCRSVLRQRDPQRCDHLFRTAAAALLDSDPVEAVQCALHGHDYGWAVDAVNSHWLNVLLAGRPADLDTVCLRLPRPWSEDPNILRAPAPWPVRRVPARW